MEFSLETSSLCVLVTEVEFKEQKEIHSHEVRIFQVEMVDLDKQLLNLLAKGLEEMFSRMS